MIVSDRIERIHSYTTHCLQSIKFIFTRQLLRSSNLKTYAIRIAVVLLAILFGTNCNYTDVSLTYRRPVTCYLAMVDDISIAGSFHMQTDTFIYNSNNKVIAMIRSVPQKLTGIYSYDSDGNIVKAIGEQNSVNSYTYDANHRIVRKDILVNSPPDYYTYEYNSSGQLVTSNFTYTAYGSLSPSLIVTHYQYPNTSTRNPSSSTSGPDWSLVTVFFEYDDKPNPHKSFFPSIETDNNLIKSTIGIGAYSQVLSYTYEYNSEGYPVSRTSSDGELRNYSYYCK